MAERTKVISHDPQSTKKRACDVVAWGGAVAAQAEIPHGRKQHRSNGSLHRVSPAVQEVPGLTPG